jgi:hypothetical protein
VAGDAVTVTSLMCLTDIAFAYNSTYNQAHLADRTGKVLISTEGPWRSKQELARALGGDRGAEVCAWAGRAVASARKGEMPDWHETGASRTELRRRKGPR